MCHVFTEQDSVTTSLDTCTQSGGGEGGGGGGEEGEGKEGDGEGRKGRGREQALSAK